MLSRLTLIFTLLVAAPAIALACRNAMLVDGDDGVQQVRHAEKLLARGKLEKARRLVDPHRYRFANKGLNHRAMVVNATVALREPGARGSDYLVTNSITYLRYQVEEDEDNPLLSSRLAEGYALSKKTRDKARAILEDLAKRDLMPEAYSYRTLARLRMRAGDNDAAHAAMKSCRKMSKRKAVCSFKSSPAKRKGKRRAKSRSRSRS